MLAAPPGDGGESCDARAARVVREAEKLPMEKRAALILRALATDRKLACSDAGTDHWSKRPELPDDCLWDALERCAFPGGIEVARELAKDTPPETYVRVQLFAQSLRRAKRLTPAFERLLETLLLSSAL